MGAGGERCDAWCHAPEGTTWRRRRAFTQWKRLPLVFSLIGTAGNGLEGADVYLYRWHCYVKNGRWREFMEVVTKVNELHEAKGHTKMRFWAGVTGRANLFIAESEFESLAAWEVENEAISRDSEIMNTLRQTVDLMDTTEVHELLQSAPEIA